MSDYVLPPPPRVALSVNGDARDYAVRRVYCVGRNYAAHAREMGHDEREPPFFFQKPADALVPGGGDVPYPPATAELHHEIELVLALGRGGRDLDPGAAAACVYGLATGVDLTRRDRQAEAKKAGRPWEIAKAFDASAPVTAITPLAGAALPERGAIRLAVNGDVRQSADLSDLIWSCAEVVAELSTLYALAPGDLIFTGTPAGVGPVVRGDAVTGTIDGLPPLSFRIV